MPDNPEPLRELRAIARDELDIKVTLAKIQGVQEIHHSENQSRLKAIEDHLARQNGRIKRVEDDNDAIRKILAAQDIQRAHDSGLKEGQGQAVLTKSQVAILISVMTVLSLASGMLTMWIK